MDCQYLVGLNNNDIHCDETCLVFPIHVDDQCRGQIEHEHAFREKMMAQFVSELISGPVVSFVKMDPHTDHQLPWQREYCFLYTSL